MFCTCNLVLFCAGGDADKLTVPKELLIAAAVAAIVLSPEAQRRLLPRPEADEDGEHRS